MKRKIYWDWFSISVAILWLIALVICFLYFFGGN